MADTLTTNIQLTNQTEGGNENTWGTKVDDNFELVDDVLGDTTDITTTGGTTDLTDDQELVMAIQVAGTLVSNAEIVFSGRGGFWIVENNTTGNFTVTCLVSGQTGVEIAQGTANLIWCDGTDILSGTPAAELVADTSPQLGADLDANGFDILFDDATGIRDDSDNEQLIFKKTASAVNHVELTNAATGNAPKLAAAGGDTNINLELAGKGTGGVVGTFTNTGLHLLDSDASHDLIVKPGSNLSADRTLTVTTGDADRTLTVEGDATLPAGTMATREPSINAQTGTSYTLALTDRGKVVTMSNANANKVTIPANASVAFPTGTVINIVQLGAGVTTIEATAGVTLNGQSAGSGDIQTQYQGVSLLKIGTDTWVASGDIEEVS